MKILLTLVSFSGVLGASYWGHLNYDKNRLRQIDQIIPNKVKSEKIIIDENIMKKQSRTYSL